MASTPCAAPRAARQAGRVRPPWLRTRRSRRRDARLTKEAHGGIPGQIGPFSQPAPFCVALERDPNRNGQSPREMRDRGVASDDEIEASHHRRRIDEGVGAGVKVGAQRLDPQRAAAGLKAAPRLRPSAAKSVSRPRFRASGASALSGMERARSASGSGLPCQTTPILKPSAPMRFSHISRNAGSAAR